MSFIKEFRLYEAKIGGSEKASSCWESNPGHLAWATTTNPHNPLYVLYWRLKQEVSWVWLPATTGLFTFLYFHLIQSSKLLYFLCKARCSEQECPLFLPLQNTSLKNAVSAPASLSFKDVVERMVHGRNIQLPIYVTHSLIEQSQYVIYMTSMARTHKNRQLE